MKNTVLILSALLCCTLCSALMAQTGPAGVGSSSNNCLWLKADAGTSSTSNNSPISFWNDQSGNAIDVTQTVTAQQPSFATNVMNGFPAILFDNVNTAGQNDKLIGPDASALDNTSGYTFFHVTRPVTLGDARVVVSKRTSVSVNQSFMLFYYTSNNLYIDVQTTNDRFASANSYSTNTNYINSLIYNGAIATSSLRCTLYRGETFDRNATETSTLVPDNASPLLIGTTDATDSRPFGGYISEVIIYREALNDAQRIIVNNYLSAKYDIALSANDKYAGDNSGNGHYDREVAGIGQESSGSNTSFSASVTGGLSMSVNSGLDDGDYLMVGHAVATNSTINSDVGGMSGSNNARWQRIWYADVTNTLTALNVDLAFDMSDGGMPTFTLGTLSNYVLLYRSGQTGNWSEIATASAISGDVIRFNGITLSNDGYYTLGTRNIVPSPLPIELLSFEASLIGEEVQLRWSTASEQNNHFFTVQRSANGIDFEDLSRVASQGSGPLRRDYTSFDKQPLPGLSYYRLQQTDLDGTSTRSPMVSLLRENNENALHVFPNPTNGDVVIGLQASQASRIHVIIRDLQGKIVYEADLSRSGENNHFQLRLNARVTEGAYLLQVNDADQFYLKKLLIR